MSKDPKRVLIDEALRIISDPEKWTQGDFYRDKEGRSVGCANDAHAFCALGAMKSALMSNGLPWASYFTIASDFRTKYGVSIDYVNDVNGRETVIKMLKGLYDE